MKKIYVLLTCFMLLAGLNPDLSYSQEKELESFHEISGFEMYQWISELSSDKYMGRLTGSDEYMESAKWIASKLEEFGVKPGGDEGSYFQYFDIPYTRVLDEGSFSIKLMNKDGQVIEKSYCFPETYFPATNSDTGEIEAEVVYVGFGVSAPELGYDDYEGIDVKGKIVLFERNVPYPASGPDFKKWVPYTEHKKKLEIASAKGAAGVIYIGNHANPNTCFNQGLIYCHVENVVANDLFFGLKTSFEESRKKIIDRLKPNSFEVNKTAKIVAHTKHYPNRKACNVIGVIEGSDPKLKSEVIIAGAHLDGVGYLGKVLPGAHDNASGCIDILAAAKALGNDKLKPKRSILFIFLGGEENGLLGSKFYASNPTWPKEKTLGYFNLDMVATGSGIGVYGVKSFPKIEQCFMDVNQKYLFREMRTSGELKASVGRPRSDGEIFLRNGFKAFSFGTFYLKGEKRLPFYYHHPLDNVKTINPEIMEDVAKIMYLGFKRMANLDEVY